MVQLLAAIVFIIYGPDVAVPTEYDFDSYRTEIRQVALAWELLDVRESEFSSRYIFISDLHTVHKRFNALKDAPSIGDIYRFPTRPYTNEHMKFNKLCQEHLTQLIERKATGSYELMQLREELQWHWKVWDTIDDLHIELTYITYKREKLAQIRELIGNKAYYNGELPPPVPMHYFEQIRTPLPVPLAGESVDNPTDDIIDD